MASIIDVFINPSTHIEDIDEESVKLMQLEYGDPAVTLGDQRYTAYGKQVVKGRLKDCPRHARLHFGMDDVCSVYSIKRMGVTGRKSHRRALWLGA